MSGKESFLRKTFKNKRAVPQIVVTKEENVEEGNRISGLFRISGIFNLFNNEVDEKLRKVSQTNQELRKEKNRKFWEFFILITSIIYGVALFMIGLVVYSTDLLFSGLYTNKEYTSYSFSDGFNIYLCLLGTIFLSGLIFDIYHYIYTVQESCDNQELITLVEAEDRRQRLQVKSLRVDLEKEEGKKRNVTEFYLFSTGRHSGSFFMKVGAAIFCFGHLIRIMLELSKQVGFYISEFCVNGQNLIFKVIYVIFSFVQLYIIFRFGNVIVNRNKTLSRFAFIHCISSSLCFWVYSIINETMDALVEKYLLKKQYSFCDEEDHGRMTRAADKFPACEVGNETEFSILNNVICNMETSKTCMSDTDGIASLFYPFSVEFSILTVGVWYVMWDNIGKVDENKDTVEFTPSFSQSKHTSGQPSRRTSVNNNIDGLNEKLKEAASDTMIISASCANSNRGLFLGLGLLVTTIACVIVHLVWQKSCDQVFVDFALILSYLIECIILFVMIIATIMAYIKIVKLDVNPHSVSFLDDLLLLICIPSYFLLFFFSVGPSIYQLMPLSFITDFLTIIQVTIQTPLIVTGLRRCSNTSKNLSELPGRNILMFLIVTNLVNYIFYILMQKSSFYEFGKIEFYGSLQWSVISHVTLPLCIFYRFHSSVALVDIWNSAYKPAD